MHKKLFELEKAFTENFFVFTIVNYFHFDAFRHVSEWKKKYLTCCVRRVNKMLKQCQIVTGTWHWKSYDTQHKSYVTLSSSVGENCTMFDSNKRMNFRLHGNQFCTSSPSQFQRKRSIIILSYCMNSIACYY